MTPKQERNLYMSDYYHDLIAYNDMSKQEALVTAAHEYDMKIETASRVIRKIKQVDNKPKTPKGAKRVDRKFGKRMIVIPDTQCKAGGKIDHIEASARYIVEQKPDIVVVLGDWWDFESLSVFNTRKQAENLRIVDDVEAGIIAMDAFMKIINTLKEEHVPRLVFCHGNHSMAVRLPRFIEEHPHLEGLIDDVTTPFLKKHGWEVYPFLEVVNIENIYISHYIQNPHSLKGAPLGGAVTTMLKNAGHSFIMGHQQTYKYTKQFLSNGEVRIGIVAGAFYQHDEGYMSIQGNRHWRGIFMLNEVKDGGGDMCEVSMNYLLKKYSK